MGTSPVNPVFGMLPLTRSQWVEGFPVQSMVLLQGSVYHQS